MKCPFSIAWEQITPELAAQWLDEHNTHNRPLRQTTVDAFARDMKTNRWSPNHQGIAFGKSGALLDGQHRLAAIVASGIAIDCLVARDVPERVEGVVANVMETVDRGTSRSLADILKLEHGIVTSPSSAAAALLHIARLCVNHPEQQTGRATMPQIALVLEHYGEALKWMSQARPRVTGLRSMIVWASLAFAYQAKPKQVAAFAERFNSGAHLASDSPVLILRTATMDGSIEAERSTTARWRTGTQVLAAVQADIEGKPLSKLPPPSAAALSLQWWRDWQSARVESIVAAFPLLRPVSQQQTTFKTREIQEHLSPTPPPTGPVVKLTDLKPTAAAERLLAKSRR